MFRGELGRVGLKLQKRISSKFFLYLTISQFETTFIQEIQPLQSHAILVYPCGGVDLSIVQSISPLIKVSSSNSLENSLDLLLSVVYECCRRWSSRTNNTCHRYKDNQLPDPEHLMAETREWRISHTQLNYQLCIRTLLSHTKTNTDKKY